MSQETRKQQRQDKKQQRLKMAVLIIIGIVILIIVGYIKDKQAILEKETWTKDTKATFYFFKSTDDAEVDDFDAKTITVEQGTKTNGYTVLASQDLTVNTGWAQKQQKILQNLIDSNAPDNWKTIVDKAVQINKDGVTVDASGLTLTGIAPYVGMTAEELAAKLQLMTQLADGVPRSITLQNLGLISSGAVYTNTTNRMKVLNENFLPYLDVTLLNAIKKYGSASSAALSVVGNDHIYAVTVINVNEEISGESQMTALKEKNLSETGTSEVAYYEMLISRDDLVREYPTLKMTIDGEETEVYFVDAKTDGKDKILVLMIKNNTALFLKEESASGLLEIQNIKGYVVKKSAVKNVNNGTGVLILMERTYFPEEVTVSITKQDGGNYVLGASDNPSLTEGSIYKVFP